MASLIFVDFETYWDKDYTLKKMTPIQYVLDRRFEALGVAVKEGRNGQASWIDRPNIPEWIRQVSGNPDNVVVSHNALFDMLILAWTYSYVPPLVLDTLGMSRAILGHKLKSHSLESVSQYFGLGSKGTVLNRMPGVNYAHLCQNQGLHSDLAMYAIDDVSKCASIFSRLVGSFPASEVPVMDMVLKACILPQFKLDGEVLTSHLMNVLLQKDNLSRLAAVLDPGDLRSNEKFAGLLRDLGVDPPTKISPITGKEVYAFAKTDSAFIDLAEHEDMAVQALVAARLGHKSSLEETRTKRLIEIEKLHWPSGAHWMPVPLRYSGAHTHRLSGDMKLNLQNLPRKSALRKALVAPKGYTVVSIDLSQIEARIVAWLCEQNDLVEAFALGEDVYSSFAEDVFGEVVTRKIRPDLRFVGKTAILGLGYGMSWMKFLLSLKSGSKNQTGVVIELTEAVGQAVVSAYRSRYYKIGNTWNMLGSTGITTLAFDGTLVFGPCQFSKQQILLPNGMKLYYHDLQQKVTNEHGTQWMFSYGGIPKHIYGAKVLENVTQALARIIIMDLGVRVYQAFGRRFAHQVHDELIYVVKSKELDGFVSQLREVAGQRPIWAPGLPLASEIKLGPNYGDLVTFES